MTLMLPLEVHYRILFHIPNRDQYRCICKAWNELIDLLYKNAKQVLSKAFRNMRVYTYYKDLLDNNIYIAIRRITFFNKKVLTHKGLMGVVDVKRPQLCLAWLETPIIFELNVFLSPGNPPSINIIAETYIRRGLYRVLGIVDDTCYVRVEKRGFMKPEICGNELGYDIHTGEFSRFRQGMKLFKKGKVY